MIFYVWSYCIYCSIDVLNLSPWNQGKLFNSRRYFRYMRNIHPKFHNGCFLGAFSPVTKQEDVWVWDVLPSVVPCRAASHSVLTLTETASPKKLWTETRVSSFINVSKNMFRTIFTARKRSLGQGNIFVPVCHSVHRGWCVSQHAPGSHYIKSCKGADTQLVWRQHTGNIKCMMG